MSQLSQHPGFEEYDYPSFAGAETQSKIRGASRSGGGGHLASSNSRYQSHQYYEEDTDVDNVEQSFSDIRTYLNGGGIRRFNQQGGTYEAGERLSLGSVVGAPADSLDNPPPPQLQLPASAMKSVVKRLEFPAGAATTTTSGSKGSLVEDRPNVDPMSVSPRRLNRRRPPPLSPDSGQVPEAGEGPPALNLTDDSKAAFLQAVWYLRRRYGDTDPTLQTVDSSEHHPSKQDLTSLVDEDVDELAQCFATELKGLAKKQRQKKGLPEPGPRNVVPSAEDLLRARLQAMTVRDAIAELRKGGMFTKFGRKGTPAIRYIRVMDRRTLHRGELAVMPHFCWAVDSHSEPSGQLPMFELQELQSGASETMKKNDEGFVVGALKEELRDSQCFTLVFNSRTVDLGCKHAEQLQLWKRAIVLIIQKNREIAARSQQQQQQQLPPTSSKGR